MATPIINDLILPNARILVLLDEGSETTGVIYRRSEMGGGRFQGKNGLVPIPESNHVLFVKEMATLVEIDEVAYMAMHQTAVVGLIPE